MDKFTFLANVLLQRRLDGFIPLGDEVEIDDTLVVCAEYQLYINDRLYTNMKHPGQPEHWLSYRFPSGYSQKPVLGVTAEDSESFCEWLNLQEFTPGYYYRLPTTAEARMIKLKDQLNGTYWCSDAGAPSLVNELEAINIASIFAKEGRMLGDFDYHLLDLYYPNAMKLRYETHLERLMAESSFGYHLPFLASLFLTYEMICSLYYCHTSAFRDLQVAASHKWLLKLYELLVLFCGIHDSSALIQIIHGLLPLLSHFTQQVKASRHDILEGFTVGMSEIGLLLETAIATISLLSKDKIQNPSRYRKSTGIEACNGLLSELKSINILSSDAANTPPEAGSVYSSKSLYTQSEFLSFYSARIIQEMVTCKTAINIINEYNLLRQPLVRQISSMLGIQIRDQSLQSSATSVTRYLQYRITELQRNQLHYIRKDVNQAMKAANIRRLEYDKRQNKINYLESYCDKHLICNIKLYQYLMSASNLYCYMCDLMKNKPPNTIESRGAMSMLLRSVHIFQILNKHSSSYAEEYSRISEEARAAYVKYLLVLFRMDGKAAATEGLRLARHRI